MGNPGFAKIFTPKQQQIIAYDNKYHPVITILEGAVRSGKTQLNNWFFFMKLAACRNQGKTFIITGYSIGSITRNVLAPLEEIFGIPIKLSATNSFSYLGNTVYCFGTDKADSYKSMTGLTAYGWYGNEITLSHPNSVKEAFDRCSGDDFWIIWDTNPDYPQHYIKTDYIDRSGEKLSNGRVWVKSWHFTIEDNTFLTAIYIESLKKSVGAGVWYDRKILGLWVVAEGAVYPGWNPDYHVCEPFEIPGAWRKFRAIDLGYNNPFCCLWGALSPDDILYIYDEHYKAGQLIKHHAKKIKERGPESMFEATVRDHDAQEGAELEDNGIYTSPAEKSVEEGIQKVGTRLKIQDNGKPKIVFFSTCKNAIREMPSYRWEPTKDGKPQKEKPLKVNDHAVDAVRYLVQAVDNGGLQIF